MQQQTSQSNSQIRSRINTNIRSDSEFDAFCIDFFPEVQMRFSNGMDRIQKLNILFTVSAATEVEEKLERFLLKNDIKHKATDHQRKLGQFVLMAILCMILLITMVSILLWHYRRSHGKSVVDIIEYRMINEPSFDAESVRIVMPEELAKIYADLGGRGALNVLTYKDSSTGKTQRKVVVLDMGRTPAQPVAMFIYTVPIYKAWIEKIANVKVRRMMEKIEGVFLEQELLLNENIAEQPDAVTTFEQSSGYFVPRQLNQESTNSSADETKALMCRIPQKSISASSYKRNSKFRTSGKNNSDLSLKDKLYRKTNIHIDLDNYNNKLGKLPVLEIRNRLRTIDTSVCYLKTGVGTYYVNITVSPSGQIENVTGDEKPGLDCVIRALRKIRLPFVSNETTTFRYPIFVKKVDM